MKFNFSYTRLYVNDYDTCLQFYRDVLGLEVVFISEVDRYVELTNGTTKLTIMCRGKLKEYFGSRTLVSFEQKGDAIALSFGVKDVDEALEYLKSKNVEVVSSSWNFADWGVKLALVRDPEGNLVELLQAGEMVGAE
ncbi:VOC family protein [Pleurocapsa sp. FMAR1]|uniref:VOC family protein n=1 Tax=Pleurocapsa sp. FMAR1 TaxID=3040204 RepID=UPI0029C723CD|nr:VOC family protein [Pleurocapsa sp. FMAR1]